MSDENKVIAAGLRDFLRDKGWNPTYGNGALIRRASELLEGETEPLLDDVKAVKKEGDSGLKEASEHSTHVLQNALKALAGKWEKEADELGPHPLISNTKVGCATELYALLSEHDGKQGADQVTTKGEWEAYQDEKLPHYWHIRTRFTLIRLWAPEDEVKDLVAMHNNSIRHLAIAAPVTPKSETAFEDEKWEWEESTDKGYGWITRKGSRLSFSLHESVRKFVELHNAALTRAFASVSSPAGSSTKKEDSGKKDA